MKTNNLFFWFIEEDYDLSESYTTVPLDSVNISLRHKLQQDNWDCGLSCVAMVLPRKKSAYFSKNKHEIIREEGIEFRFVFIRKYFYPMSIVSNEISYICSTWTIDLAYLLKRFDVKFKYYTSTIGICPVYYQHQYYKTVLPNVSSHKLLLVIILSYYSSKIPKSKIFFNPDLHSYQFPLIYSNIPFSYQLLSKIIYHTIYLFQDESRVEKKFRNAAKNGILICMKVLSESALIHHLSDNGPIIVLTNANLLTCDVCNKVEKVAAPLQPYQGHYVVLIGYSFATNHIFYKNPSKKHGKSLDSVISQ